MLARATGTGSLCCYMMVLMGSAIQARADQAKPNVIVLLTDGDYNEGPSPDTLIPALKQAGVSVIAIGVGGGISTGGQAILQKLARETGGRTSRSPTTSPRSGRYSGRRWRPPGTA